MAWRMRPDEAKVSEEVTRVIEVGGRGGRREAQVTAGGKEMARAQGLGDCRERLTDFPAWRHQMHGGEWEDAE